MTDTEFRDIARAGLAPLLDHGLEAPTWEDLEMPRAIPVAAPAPPRVPRRAVALAALLGLTAVVAATSLLFRDRPSDVGEQGAALIAGEPQGLGLAETVALRVVAVKQDEAGFSVADLAAGASTPYLPDRSSLPIDTVHGAVLTTDGRLIVWSADTAWVISETLDRVEVELQPDPAPDPGLASFEARPTLTGDRVWLIQGGWQDRPTLLQLVDGRTGRLIATAEVAADARPMATAGDSLVLRVGGRTPSATRVLLVDATGTVIDLGAGRAWAASASRIARIACPSGATGEASPWTDVTPNCELLITGTDGDDEVTVAKPEGHVWAFAGGPAVPSSTPPLATVSPEGTSLLVFSVELDPIGRLPDRSVLLMIDMTSGAARQVTEFDGAPPMVTWSADGHWIAAAYHVADTSLPSDLLLIAVEDPSRTILLTGVIPAGHHVLAAG